MANGLIDTSVLVDILRQYTPAHNWLRHQLGLGVTHIVWLELIEGARDKLAQQRAVKLLNEFEVVSISTLDFEWATQGLMRLRLSHNVDVFDCLIAAPAQRLGLPLYTRNLKHFTPLLGPLANQPY